MLKNFAWALTLWKNSESFQPREHILYLGYTALCSAETEELGSDRSGANQF